MFFSCSFPAYLMTTKPDDKVKIKDTVQLSVNFEEISLAPAENKNVSFLKNKIEGLIDSLAEFA